MNEPRSKLVMLVGRGPEELLFRHFPDFISLLDGVEFGAILIGMIELLPLISANLILT